jgi:maltose O-acetyltransferase
MFPVWAQGYNITLGKKVYMNFDCCILDCAPVDIGDRVLFGPKVQIYPPGHAIDPVLRNGVDGPEYAKAVKIGNDVWVGGGAIIIGAFPASLFVFCSYVLQLQGSDIH